VVQSVEVGCSVSHFVAIGGMLECIEDCVAFGHMFECVGYFDIYIDAVRNLPHRR